MTEQIQKIISQHENSGDFTHAHVTLEQIINAAEKELGVKLPQQYIAFLLEYGHGGIGGIEIIGIGKTGNMLFVKETQQHREYGLPNNLVVVEDCNEWVYCIDCSNETIVSWSETICHKEFNSFDEYLTSRFQDAVENM